MKNKTISRFQSMDPVQNDRKLLGVKPLEPDHYNIHNPPLPKDGKDDLILSKYVFKPNHFYLNINMFLKL